MTINKELQDYIEDNVFPEYKKNEKGHNIDHIKYVIENLSNLLGVSVEEIERITIENTLRIYYKINLEKF